MSYAVKDSGQRQAFDSGMVRDVTSGKTDYSLALDGPMFDRWAAHLTKGADKYSKRNWMLAEGAAEYQRFRESAFRHFLQWFRGDTDEDHAAAVFFNINGAEFVKPNTGMIVPDLGTCIQRVDARPIEGCACGEPRCDGLPASAEALEPEPVGSYGYVIPEAAKLRP